MLFAFLVCLAGMALLWTTLVWFELDAKADAPAEPRSGSAGPAGGDGVIPLAVENASRPLRRRRLSRLPAAAPDLRRDHGREAPADPARARLARRPGRASQGRGKNRGIGRSASGRRRSRQCAREVADERPARPRRLPPDRPLALREQLALTEGRAAGVLNGLVSEEPISEAVALSTCNRTELYLVADRLGRGRGRRRSASSPARRGSGRPSCSGRSTRCAAPRPPGTSTGSPPGSTR